MKICFIFITMLLTSKSYSQYMGMGKAYEPHTYKGSWRGFTITLEYMGGAPDWESKLISVNKKTGNRKEYGGEPDLSNDDTLFLSFPTNKTLFSFLYIDLGPKKRVIGTIHFGGTSENFFLNRQGVY